jgi:hypothetical protein
VGDKAAKSKAVEKKASGNKHKPAVRRVKPRQVANKHVSNAITVKEGTIMNKFKTKAVKMTRKFFVGAASVAIAALMNGAGVDLAL